jgi:hypothetical protein
MSAKELLRKMLEKAGVATVAGTSTQSNAS